jgi:hypothetical protein
VIYDHLLDELDKVAARFRQLRFWQWLALAWLGAAALAIVLWAWRLQSGVSAGVALALVAIAAAALASLGLWRALTTARDYRWLARRIESSFPELHSCLVTAVEQQPELPGRQYGYLQTSVIHDALLHARQHPWGTIVSSRSMALAVALNLLSLGLLLAAVAAAVFAVVPPAATVAAAMAERGLSLPGTGFAVTVEPGDTEVERGTSLLVLARITGSMPAEATLVYQPDGGELVRLPMAASLNDPVFGGRIPLVDQPLNYHIELGGQETPRYRATVFEYPRLERSDARLEFPAYTGQESRLVQDVRTVSVVEGTKLTLECYLNKPVASATLVDTRQDAPAEPLVLTAIADSPALVTTTILCQASRRLELQLVDAEGRRNVQVARFSIQVIPNTGANLKPTFPARDLEVSALEELDVKATAWDDFGLVRVGLSYSLGGEEPVDVVLAERAAAKEKHNLAHTISLEELGAEPDQLLSYYWWAEDHDADGNVRRTMSDMYFAEVRPFEEIFRQGQQPAGGEEQQRQQQQQQQGQGQNARDAQELAKLQKDIINATWKVVRRETLSEPTAAFAGDVDQIRQSQESALEQAAGLGERVEDEESQEHVEAVLQHMQTSLAQLTAAGDGKSPVPLESALTAQQAAYQSLLRLRAREHEVVRQQQSRQQSQSQQQSSARSQQQREQLEQLNLREEENRYETERTARELQEESAADRENRQILNRLRELARRQHDLNERLKELQSALEEAATPEQQEDVRRQLARLQEEQRQMLADTDELQSRLDQPQNQENMAEQQQQLDETRDQVRRAAEALERQEVSQAAASGTRAEQQFEELREEFRRRAANRFTEDVQNMRQAARELDERQEALSRQLAGEEEPSEGPPSLRENDERESIVEQLGQQQQRLSNLQEQMRETIQEAEETEPLLSQRLYDTIRRTQDQQLERTLQAAERSVRQGLDQDARQLDEAAGQGIQQLREGIDQAAESVLGDSTEALRLARQELNDLSQQLNQEIERNSPDGSPVGQQPGQQQPGQQQPGEGQPAERQPGEQPGQQAEPGQQNQPGQPGERPGRQPGEEGQPQPGQGQPGEQQPGQREPGQGQPGQGQPGQRQPGEGQQPGERQPNGEQPNGQQPGGQQPGGRPGNRQGQPGEQQGQPGEQNQPSEQGQPGQNQPGRGQPGQNQPGQNQPGQGQPNEQGQPGSPRGGRPGGPPRLDERGSASAGGNVDEGPRDGTSARGTRQFAPIGGEDFRDWSDRLRDVEEMVDDPELRAEAARIRERARAIRAELKRHSAEPQWDVVTEQLSKPLTELGNRVAEELLRRTSQKAVVPLDRDPVPPQYTEKTRRYYERLGSGR